MKKTTKKQFVISADRQRLAAGSVIAALIAAIALFVTMLQMEKKQLSEFAKGNILVAACRIPEGQLITEKNADSFFQTMELDQKCIPETALTSVEQVKDLITVADIEQGVLLTTGMFEQMDQILSKMKDPVIAGCKADDLYQIVGGVLRCGDRIHIYSVSEEGETSLIWQDVFVRQVFDSSGSTIENSDETQPAQRINIALEKEDVEKFYTALAEGSLRVVKVCD